MANKANSLIATISEGSLFPGRRDLYAVLGRRDTLLEAALTQGLQALGWLVDERGLGGGKELDGLAWTLPLDRLWELYVANHVARMAKEIGGQLLVGHKGQTVFPLQWNDSSLRSLGHLAPDIIFRRPGEVRVFDAKYKAHLAEIDESGWLRLSTEIREAHRGDIHQALAYAALFETPRITTTLVYPLRPATAASLKRRGRDLVRADLFHGGRQLRLELLGLPFGGVTRPTVQSSS